MYRALDLHFTLYLALYKLYIEKFINTYPIIEKELKETVVNAITNLIDYCTENRTTIQQNHRRVVEAIESTNLLNLLEQFDKSLENQSKFYRNYMNLFELLLQFIRASREQCWSLHLNSLSDLCPYFFGYDMINYARMTPVHLSQMFSLMEKDPDIWRFFEEGNFSVNKSNVRFSAIGPDHGIEQENRALKVLGGIKGIANSEDVPNEYFVTAGEIGNMVEKLCETFHVAENQWRKRDEHHQLYGSKKGRIENNSKSSRDF